MDWGSGNHCTLWEKKRKTKKKGQKFHTKYNGTHESPLMSMQMNLTINLRKQLKGTSLLKTCFAQSIGIDNITTWIFFFFFGSVLIFPIDFILNLPTKLCNRQLAGLPTQNNAKCWSLPIANTPYCSWAPDSHAYFAQGEISKAPTAI